MMIDETSWDINKTYIINKDMYNVHHAVVVYDSISNVLHLMHKLIFMSLPWPFIGLFPSFINHEFTWPFIGIFPAKVNYFPHRALRTNYFPIASSFPGVKVRC